MSGPPLCRCTIHLCHRTIMTLSAESLVKHSKSKALLSTQSACLYSPLFLFVCLSCLYTSLSVCLPLCLYTLLFLSFFRPCFCFSISLFTCVCLVCFCLHCSVSVCLLSLFIYMKNTTIYSMTNLIVFTSWKTVQFFLMVCQLCFAYCAHFYILLKQIWELICLYFLC